MDSAISKEELMEALKHLQIVEQLPRTTVEEFCRVFKITEGIRDFRGLLAVLKTKIVDIFLQERQGYEDYLQLPKFRAMGPELCQQLISLFKNIWTECHNRHQQFRLNSVSRELEKIAPVFQNEAQAQNFHRQLLQLYKDSGLCQRKKPVPKKIQEHQKNQQESPSNIEDNNLSQNHQKLSNQLPSGIAPYLSLPNPQPKLEAQQGVGYLFDNKQPQKQQPLATASQSQPIFQVPRFQVQPPFLVPSSQLDFYQNQLKMAYSGKNEGTFLYRPPPTSIARNIFSQQLVEQTIKRFKGYQYVLCCCEGKKTSDMSASFKCESCQFSYHYSCMMMEGEANEAVTCPLCILRKQTLFCTVVKEPLKCIWHLQERHKFEFHLQMNEEDSNQIYDARRHGLDCQVRFLKIDGKLFKRDSKDHPEVFQQSFKHSQITLPELSQDKDHPIALEVLLRPDDETDQSRRLYFFAVFLVRMKRIQEILMEVFDSNNYFGESYYNQFMDQSQKIVVPLKQNSQRESLIKYPVRGAECKHAEVFDFKKFLEKVNDLKRQKEKQLACEICGRPCSSFKYDSLINRCINGFSDYDDRQPEAIQICRNGQIQWVSLNIADSEQKRVLQNGSKEPQHQKFFVQEEDSDSQESQ